MLESHKKIERNSMLLLIFSILAVSVGGIVEIVPLFRMETTIERVQGMRPYTPLELAGQNITITRIGPNDPPGAVAAAVHRSLTATRKGRRLSERHAGRTQPSIPPLSPTNAEGVST